MAALRAEAAGPADRAAGLLSLRRDRGSRLPRTGRRRTRIGLRLGGYALRRLGLRLAGGLTATAEGRLLAALCRDLGGLWVELARLLAVRRDVFADAFCDALGEVADAAPPLPAAAVLAMVEAELPPTSGAGLAELEPAPVRSTSIAQTHRAWLRHGAGPVLVTVQRPHAPESMRRDLALLRRWLRLPGALPGRSRLDRRDLLRHLRRAVEIGLDYRVEAAEMERARKLLGGHHAVVPEVFVDLCTRRLLVRQWLEGPSLDGWLASDEAAAGVDPRRLARRLHRSLLRQILEEPLFLTDWRTSGILPRPDGRFGLIAGRRRQLSQRELQVKLDLVLRAVWAQRFARAAEILMLLAPLPPATDEGKLKSELSRLLRNFRTAAQTAAIPYREKATSGMLVTAARLLAAAGVELSWTLLEGIEAQVRLDRLLAVLDPDGRPLRQLERYWRRQRRRRLESLAGQGGRLRRASDLATIAGNAPARLYEDALLLPEATRRRSWAFDKVAGPAGHLLAAGSDLVAKALLACGGILLATLAGRLRPGGLESWWGPGPARLLAALPGPPGAALLLAGVACLYWQAMRLRRRFSRNDTRPFVGRS